MMNVTYRFCEFNEAQKIHDLTNEVMRRLAARGLTELYGGVSKSAAESSMCGDSVIYGAFKPDRKALLGHVLFEFVSDEITGRYAEAFGISDYQRGDIVVLNGMAVSPSYWGRGIGSNLLWYAKDWAAFTNVKYLVGIVHPENTVGLHILNKHAAQYGPVFGHATSRGNLPRRRFCIKVD